MLRQVLRDDPNGTTLISELPPEATVYLPLDLPFNPDARTIYLLIDDRRDLIKPTPEYAAKKLPQFKVKSVTQVEMAPQAKARWKLFAFLLQ
jgi:hypothetical protein